MTARSALLYAIGTWIGAAAVELWLRHLDPTHSPPFGYVVAAFGIVAFGVFFGFVFFAYGAARRAVRGEPMVAALAPSFLLGLALWPVLNSLHDVVRDRLGLPDALWFLEVVVLIALSYEAIRLPRVVVAWGALMLAACSSAPVSVCTDVR